MKKLIKIIVYLILVPIATFAQHIGAGTGRNTIVAKDNGIAFAWGNNNYGQLGIGYVNPGTDIPVEVLSIGALSGKIITKVAAGRFFSISLTSDGKVYTWGNNDYGQLGNGSTTQSSEPVEVDISGALNGKTIIQVAAGSYFSIALDSDGKIYTWGDNHDGQLGIGNTTDSYVPVSVNMDGVLAGKTITQISAGDFHIIVIDSDGKVYGWGKNDNGPLGNGTTTESHLPVAVNMGGVLLGKTITQIAAGSDHSIALSSEGKVYTFGSNRDGMLGNGSGISSYSPVEVDISGVLAGKIITKIAASAVHSMALSSDGMVFTWGYNGNGQLGNGNNTESHVPVSIDISGVMAGKTITQIAAGSEHSIALSSDGYIFTWGYNIYGQLGNGNIGVDSNVPVEVCQGEMGQLPVELTTFTATSIDKKVVLNWQTATEVNNYGFDVETLRATSNEWKKIGFVEGHGNSNSPKNYSYIDDLLNLNRNLNLKYRLKQIDTDGNFEYSDIVEINLSEDLPTKFELAQNYPNPFNPSTEIKFTIPQNSHVKLELFNTLGKKVATLINEEMSAGFHNYQLSIINYQLPSGVYFYKLQSGNFNQVRKMLLLK